MNIIYLFIIYYLDLNAHLHTLSSVHILCSVCQIGFKQTKWEINNFFLLEEQLYTHGFQNQLAILKQGRGQHSIFMLLFYCLDFQHQVSNLCQITTTW